MTDLAAFEDDLLASFPDLPGVRLAVYRSKAGGESATFVLVSDRQVVSEQMARGEYAQLRLPIRDVPEPDVDDVVEVDGILWQHRPRPGVGQIRRRSWPFWILSCRRDVRPVPGGAK